MLVRERHEYWLSGAATSVVSRYCCDVLRAQGWLCNGLCYTESQKRQRKHEHDAKNALGSWLTGVLAGN